MRSTDLYLLGSGIHGSLHLTLETIQALEVASIVFVLHDDLRVIHTVRKHAAEVRDLATVYDHHTERPAVYREISKLLVSEASRRPPVAFLVHGHPLFLVSATEFTLELARDRGLRTRILPAISSFDTILCDIQRDYGYAVQVFDATTLVANAYAVNSQVPLLVFQIATVMSSHIQREPPDPNSLRPLMDHLLRYYPGDTECLILHSATQLLELRSQQSLRVCELSSSTELELWKRPTLYIPGYRNEL